MKARGILIGIIVGAVMVGTLVSQTKSASRGNQKAAEWSTKVVLNDDWLGIYSDTTDLSPDTRARLTDHLEAATKFATAFALDRSCMGLTLLLDSRTGGPLPSGRYWWVDFRLGPTKETSLETTTRELQGLAAHGPNQPYVHIDNPWFNWSIEHHPSGANEGYLGEDSDMSSESAAHSVCMFVKSGGAVLGGSSAGDQAAQAPKGKEPTAAEVFHFRSECSEFGKQVLAELVSNLREEAAKMLIRKSQVSHYNPTANRCYVEITLETAIAGSPWRNTGIALYDGQTHENLAHMKMEGTECPSGKDCKWSGSIHNTTEHYGVDENLEHARKFMADAMEYPQQ